MAGAAHAQHRLVSSAPAATRMLRRQRQCSSKHHISLVRCCNVALHAHRGYFFSVPFFLCEFSGFILSNAFIASMWNQLHRPPRHISDMLEPELLPAVDVFIATYSGERPALPTTALQDCSRTHHTCAPFCCIAQAEPVDVVEPTVIGALNLDYPGTCVRSRLCHACVPAAELLPMPCRGCAAACACAQATSCACMCWTTGGGQSSRQWSSA